MPFSTMGRQRGSFNLYWVAILSALFAALAMAALWSWRYEKNVFVEGMAKVGKMVGNSPAQEVVDSAKGVVSSAAGKGDGKLRKCTINGKTVISNEECLDSNPTSQTMKLTTTRGIEAPRVPPPPPKEESGSNPMIDKAIEKQLR